jgi:peptidoglycan-associated lipoprotein
MQMQSAARLAASPILVLVLALGACSTNQSPVVHPMPAPEPAAPAAQTPPPPPSTPPQAVTEEPVVPTSAVEEAVVDTRSLDELNRDSPLDPVFFEYDASTLSEESQQALNRDAEVLKSHPTWVITIEGHCDERGTAEYNLALGERRAVAARSYLVSLGVAADRLRTVSYGKEFPFDPGHTEAAWAKNRRAHFVITAK